MTPRGESKGNSFVNNLIICYSPPLVKVDENMRIAYLEDDNEHAAMVYLWLNDAGYDVQWFSSGLECARVVAAERFDACLFDWSVEDLAGIEVMSRLRIKLRQAMPPVLFLTGRNNEEDIVEALNAGADDYLIKPFTQPILLARLQAVLRRYTSDALPQMQDFGQLIVDHGRRQITANGQSVAMTERETDLALHFFQNIGRLLTREHLIKVVWGLSANVDTRTVDVHVSALRRKIGLTPEFGWRLVSVYGHGYRLEKLKESP
jgi:DNA-binding response OmpR family regulator